MSEEALIDKPAAIAHASARGDDMLQTGLEQHRLLRALARHAPPGIDVAVFDALAALPVFTPDLDGADAPDAVVAFRHRVERADALVVASPEYVRTLPGGLKNAIDWLVSEEALIDKPAAIAHASARGDDMLQTLRTVLGTVTSRFEPSIFVRVALASADESGVASALEEPDNVERLRTFLRELHAFARLEGDIEGGRTTR